MRRYFVELKDIQGEKVFFNKEQSHHMSKVLRSAPGERVDVCTGDGTVYHAVLESFEKDKVTAVIIGKEEHQQETAVPICLYQGMPKADKLEWIIQKCTELGISAIIPVETGRSVIHLDGEKAEKKIDRWQKIAQEASQQSKRVTIPKIGPYLTWKQFLPHVTQQDSEITIILWEDEQTHRLKEVLQEVDWEKTKRINLVVGPEGGMSEGEVAQLREVGGVTASLGKRILRTETAGLAAVSMIEYELDEV